MMYGLYNGWSGGNMMGWFGGGIMMLAFWALFIIFIVWMVREVSGKNGYSSSKAIDILKERYAKGEINKEEFEAKKKDLANWLVSTVPQTRTFDCSSFVRIPSLNIPKILPPSGTTDINIGSPQVATLYGTCGMGMYPFEIDFQS